MEKLYEVKEVCEILHLHYQSVYKLLRSGKLKAVRPGRKWLIPESEIQRFLEDNREIL